MLDKTGQGTTDRRMSAIPAGRERVCLFILEPREDCPSRKTSYKTVCPFTLEPCLSEEELHFHSAEIENWNIC
jgi:hypothetical protein